MNKTYWHIVLVVLTATCFSCKHEAVKRDVYQFYVGTYTQKEGHVDGKGKGIYHIEIDMSKKAMKILDTIGDLINPSFLTTSHDGNIIYAVNEISPNPNNWPGKISVIIKDSLGFRKSQEAGSFGNAPCHIALHPSGKMVAAANYMGAYLCYAGLDNNGKITGEIKSFGFEGKSKHARQEAPHLHQVVFTKDGKYLLVSDLGADSIRVLRYDSQTNFVQTWFSMAADSADGPRHMVLSADEKKLYVLNELSNTLATYAIHFESKTYTKPNKTSTLPSGFGEFSSAADIHLRTDGHFLYTTNRGHNSIASFKITDGMPELIGHFKTGKTPRNFTLTNDGAYLICANQDSNDIYIYEIETNGNLNFMQKFELPTPVCIKEI